MKFSIPLIKGRYEKEFKRLFVFSHLLLPLLSSLSLLTGWYFLANKIMPGLFPQLEFWQVGLLALTLVVLIEVSKYFLSPLVSKSLWHTDFVLTLILTPIVFSLFITSVTFSIKGVDAFYQDQDQSSEIIKAQFAHLKDSLENSYSLELTQKDSALSQLEKVMQNPQVLKRLDRINKKIAQTSAAHQAAQRDSLKRLFAHTLGQLTKEKSLIMASSGAAVLQSKKIEILHTERKEIQQQKDLALKELQEEKAHALKTHTKEGNVIQNYILYISLGIELLILICLSYIQWYKLRALSSKYRSEPTDLINQGSQLRLAPSSLKKDEGPNETYLKNLSHEIPFDGMATSSSPSLKKKKASSNKNRTGRKRLSPEEKEEIRIAFTQVKEGSIENLVKELIAKYKVSRSTIYRLKGDG